MKYVNNFCTDEINKKMQENYPIFRMNLIVKTDDNFIHLEGNFLDKESLWSGVERTLRPKNIKLNSIKVLDVLSNNGNPSLLVLVD